ncbi:ATP-dependent sacrificial sulfur transferase LarE [Brachybacterium squillarum]|uniref:ATP-dependent sacrificial sulfur transferase LarE n=1 Tax=Brachybacterium squillarum TaxID=661979 RepID=UPI0022231BE4|nr:ATP-dependent sacrificial sulfur transferase LarE [Brachybacterium squillarum]MCW1804895.1 ATP-dependent sacrificial sulfur transferase LarE [Brachybacterium squillarum]
MTAAATIAPTLTPDALTGEALTLADDVATQLSGVRRLGVAYSGGVDSATLLALAVRALGSENVVALLGVSASLARREHRLALRTAQEIGAEVVEIATAEMDNPEYAKNDAARCFHCKDELFTRIDEEIVAAHALDAVAYGENADDATRHDRPGAGAATRHRVLRPLATAGMTKAQVRDVARGLSLSVADKPAAPCLSSRIPFGQAVTPEKLRQIDELEDAVFGAGFSDCRVRHHGDVARIELPTGELPRAVEPAVRAALVAAGRSAGFRHVTIDLEGIRSGLFALQVVRRDDA